MDLAHARFRHAHHGADLAQVQVLLVVQAHHQLLALGQRLDGGDHRLAQIVVEQLVQRRRVVLGGAVLDEGVGVFAVEVFVVQQLAALQLHQQLLVVGQRHVQGDGNLGLGRRAALLLLQLLDRLLDGARVAAQPARQPVRAAQLVQDGATDALGGIELELHALGFFVARQRVEQPHHAGLDQVVELDAGRQLHHHLVGDAAHQRCVRGHLVGLGLATGSGIHVHACLWRVLHDAPSINHLGRARGGVGRRDRRCLRRRMRRILRRYGHP